MSDRNIQPVTPDEVQSPWASTLPRADTVWNRRVVGHTALRVVIDRRGAEDTASAQVSAGEAVQPAPSEATGAPASFPECVSLRSPVGGRAKRAVDIVLAGIALGLAIPIMAILTAVVWIFMGRPVFFSQERIGWQGRTFRCFKFRTMVVNGDEVLCRHLETSPEAAREWSETCKLVRDPRVTPLGLFLRKSSLDELPQILNILRGDMSCVGPRPIVQSEIVRYGAEFADYARCRPGLTGLWQSSGRSALSYESRVSLDSKYASNWSMGLDARIIIRTIPALLKINESA